MKPLFNAEYASFLSGTYILRNILKDIKERARSGHSQANFSEFNNIKPGDFSDSVISDLTKLGFTVVTDALPDGSPIVRVYWPKSSKV